MNRSLWTNLDLLDTNLPGTKVSLAPQLFAFGVHFMMREIELAALTTKDLKLDESKRLVTVTWRESKMDQEGASISRSLQCICESQCTIDCPFSVAEVMLNSTMLRGAPQGHIALCNDGTVST